MSQLSIVQRNQFAPRPGFRVTVHREPDQAAMRGQHRHDFFEVVWILAGRGVHVTGSFRHRIEGGDVLVLDPRRAHGYEECAGLHLINLLLDPSLVPEWQQTFSHVPGFQQLFLLTAEHWERQGYSSRLHLEGQDAADLNEWISRMETETHSPSLEAPLLAESWALQVVGLLSRRGAEGYRAQRAPAVEPAGINRLFSWIELHVEDPLHVEDLAREAGLSVRSLQRRFRERTGQSPMQYLQQRRMRRAERLLLRERQLSIAEVARRCGFQDPNHFSAAVRSFFGHSPRALRQGKTASRA